MIYVKEIEDYINYTVQNPNRISDDVKLLIKNIVKPTLKRTDIVFDKDTFDKCVRYCEKWYYPLFLYQKFIYAFVFMYESDNTPVFRTFLIMLGRGNGKDGLMMPLCDFLTSEYYGISNYNIDIVATSEDQAKDSYNIVYDMYERNSKLMKQHYYWNKIEKIDKTTKSKLRYNTSSADTKDGKKTGAVLFNEYHAYKTSDQIKVFQSGLGKVEHPRIFIITTQGYVREGPLDELLDVCLPVLKGESNELRYFPFICRLKSEKDADNPDLWEQANPSLPYIKVLRDNIKLDYLEMKKFPSKVSEFMTKRMNIPKRDEAQCVTSWNNILKASYSDVENKIERIDKSIRGQSAIVGIDFASLRDFATAGFLTKIDNEYVWRCRTWICKSNPFFDDIKFPFNNIGQPGFNDFVIVDKTSIDENDIVDWIISNMDKYSVKKIILDSYRYKLMRMAFERYGLQEETKKNPNGIIRMIRYPASIAAIIAPKIETDFANQNINIGNSSMMRWAINNTCVKDRKDGNKTYEKIEPKLRKNDPFMAFVCAMSAYELLEEFYIYV